MAVPPRRVVIHALFRTPTRGHAVPYITNIEKRGEHDRCIAGAGRRRRHKGKAIESEEGDATLDLLLKHPDATLATYVCRQMKHLKHVSETLEKSFESICNS
jgi:hypothetical protein